MDTGLSASDVLALTKNNECGMFGGDSWAWIILVILLGGAGGFGYNNRGFDGRVATVEDVNNSANFTRLENQVRFNENAIQAGFMNTFNGICDSTFALNNSITTEGRNLQTQIANCCCTTKEAIHAEGEATRALIQQNKIEALQQKINALELQAATCGVVRYPTAMTYNAGGSPFCATGCGCGNI